MWRGREKKRDQNEPSVNQKTQLSSPISSGNTQRAALTRWIAGLAENNYGIISSSDNPRLIKLGFALQNQVKGEEARAIETTLLPFHFEEMTLHPVRSDTFESGI